MTLAVKTYSAARWTTISTVVRASLQLLQIGVLARFLAPADYGLMAMVMVVLSYAGLFGDMGLSTAFVQRQQISHEERSSLYWLSVAIGAGLMLIVMAISPLAAMFFKQPQLIDLIMLVATNFLVVALGQQLRMDAEKSLNFRPVALIEIISAFMGTSLAILTAWLEWGVYALVVGAMASNWLTTLLSWRILSDGWIPAWRLRWTEVRWYVHFGGSMLLNNVISQINATVDLMLGGRMLGASQLGLYSVPRNITLQVQFMINPIFTRISFPLIASIQDDKERVKQIYLRTMNMTASVNAPIYVALAIFAPEIILLLLGQEWTDASPLMRVLALWGLLRSFGNPVGSLLFGLGYIRLAAKWNAGLLLIMAPVVWFCSQWGAIAMAWSMAGLMAALFVPGWAILVKPTSGAGLGEYFSEVALPTLCALVAGLVVVLAISPIEQTLLRLLIGLSWGLVVYVFLSWVLNREFCNAIVQAFGNGYVVKK